MEEQTAAGHVLVFPLPAQGHLNSGLALAELLALAGLHVTFLNTDYIQRSLPRVRPKPRLQFRSIPDGLPDDHPRSVSAIWDLEASLRTKAVISYKELLAELSLRDPDGRPPLTCVIADGIMPFATDAAEEMGIPGILFRTVSACSIWTYLCIPDLLQSGEVPFPAEADLDEPIRSVAGMESVLRRRDLSLFVRNAKDANDQALQTIHNRSAQAPRARAFILNTFEDLESSTLSRIRATCPNTYAVGPLHALLKAFNDHSDADDEYLENGRGAHNGIAVYSSLLEQDRTCLAWLDAQPRSSVVYVSFGSLTIVSEEDFVEFLAGFVNSGHRFLWVVRSDLINEQKRDLKNGCGLLVPEELQKAAKQRGYLVEWAPQQEVLDHPAVGGFLTHSGWNSTLESIVAGVPMLCWPYFADQQINSRFVSEEWKVGLDMKDMRGREVVERMVRELMEGQRAEQLRSSATDMANKARSSVAKGGSSYDQFQKLTQHLRSFQ